MCATVLAIRHNEGVVHDHLNARILCADNMLLRKVRKDSFERLRNSPAFVMISDVGLPTFRTDKLLIALTIVAGVVGTAVLTVVGTARHHV